MGLQGQGGRHFPGAFLPLIPWDFQKKKNEHLSMTTVIVNSGACGYSVTIKAEKGKDGKITISLATDCEMVTKMLEDIAIVDRFATLTGFQNNPVYRSASKNLKHVACAVPSAILKAIEVEAGLNVPKDVVIRFAKE